MTEKDRIDDLYDIAVLDRALYREEFRRQIESNQQPIREGLIKLREKYKSMFNDYEEMYWEGSAEDLSDVLEGFIKDIDLLISKDNDGE